MFQTLFNVPFDYCFPVYIMASSWLQTRPALIAFNPLVQFVPNCAVDLPDQLLPCFDRASDPAINTPVKDIRQGSDTLQTYLIPPRPPIRYPLPERYTAPPAHPINPAGINSFGHKKTALSGRLSLCSLFVRCSFPVIFPTVLSTSGLQYLS